MGDRLIAKPPSAYAAAADPLQYRVADAAVALCRRHGAAAVLCATAGKEGRRGGTAAVGATLFWLTCPHLNAVVARLERNGAVAALQRLMEQNPAARAAHIASHERFERRARALLCAERWDFFAAHFASGGAAPPPAEEKEEKEKEKEKKEKEKGAPHRKYGNAGVARAADVKCLHALVAQSLAGARNAIGDAVLRHVRALAQSCGPNASSNTASNVEGKCAQERREALDGVDALVALVAAAAAEEAKEKAEEEKEKEKEKEAESAKDGAGEPMDADELCRAAGLLLTFLEGREPRARRKRRIN